YKEIIDEYCAVMDSKKLSSMQKQFAILNNEKQEVIAKNFKLQTRINQFQEAIESMPVKKQQLEISSLEQDLINKKLQAKQLSKKLGIKMNDFMPKITMIYPNSAKVRIQNQLSYKLGQAMIVNSKSILG
ncbi:sugar transferase, partial [Campylobacter coli]|nr:sugar transferase [Campylobacter coli]